MICPKCKRRYAKIDFPECPHCAAEERKLWETVYGFMALSLVAIAVVMIGLTCQGCAAGTQRKAIVTAGDVAKQATVEARAYCRKLAEEGCKTNPCPALVKCHSAERYINAGARQIVFGLEQLNEVIE